MKRLMQFTAALAFALAVTACADDDAKRNTATGTGGVAGTSGAMDADREFVQEQLSMGQAEIQLGRLAQERGTHADVKEYGAMMVQQHQKAADELKAIAAKVRGTETTTGTSGDDHQEKVEELSKLSGRDFDRKYIDQMIEDHEEGIRELENKAENAANPQVKAWASKTLPTMRQHLERARSIKETLDRAQGN